MAKTITLDTLIEELPERVVYYKGILQNRLKGYRKISDLLTQLGTTNAEIRSNKKFLQMTQNLTAAERKEKSKAIVELHKSKPKMVTENQIEAFIQNPTKEKAQVLFDDIMSREGKGGVTQEISNMQNRDALIEAFQSVEGETTEENFNTTPHTKVMLDITYGVAGKVSKEKRIVEDASEKNSIEDEIKNREGEDTRVIIREIKSPLSEKIGEKKKTKQRRKIGEKTLTAEDKTYTINQNITDSYLEFLKNKKQSGKGLQKLTFDFLPKVNNKQMTKNNIFFKATSRGFLLNPYLATTLEAEVGVGQLIPALERKFKSQKESEALLTIRHTEEEAEEVLQEVEDFLAYLEDEEIIDRKDLNEPDAKGNFYSYSQKETGVVKPKEERPTKEDVTLEKYAIVFNQTATQILREAIKELDEDDRRIARTRILRRIESDSIFPINISYSLNDYFTGKLDMEEAIGTLHLASRYFDELDSYDKQDWPKYQRDLEVAIDLWKQNFDEEITNKVQDIIDNPKKYTTNPSILMTLLVNNGVISEVE